MISLFALVEPPAKSTVANTVASPSTRLVKTVLAIPDVSDVIRVALLPGEEKRKHLDTILSKLPEPIIDIDIHGQIINITTVYVNTYLTYYMCALVGPQSIPTTSSATSYTPIQAFDVRNFRLTPELGSDP